MGLDQYAIARKGEPTTKEEVFTITDENGDEKKVVENYIEYEDSKELAYWRKHPNLQGFMEHLYAEKGGTEEFNCVDLELTLEDIDSLEISVKGEELPETGGFFFGDCSDEHYKEEDLQFCKDAREALANGQTVVYSSWW